MKFYVNELLYDGTHFYPNHIKTLPIKVASSTTQKPINEIVKNIRVKQSQYEDTTDEVNKLDLMIYKLYDIKYSELSFIDPANIITEKVYNNLVPF